MTETGQATLPKHPAVAYITPFAVFMLFLWVGPRLPFGVWEQPLRVIVLSAVLYCCSRRVVDLRTRCLLGSLLLGSAVFAVWIAPDLLWPGYRGHWLFENALTGKAESSIPEGFRVEWVMVVFRAIRAVVLVPIIEELFWRAWLMRWLIDSDFEKVPLGSYAASSFWITALLFASEHGAYWDVGLLTGIAYNWWMIRTKRLGDCIVAHAVTNAVLSAYVVLAGKWEYWL